MSLLECRNVSKSFGGVVALTNVTFGVEKGEILGVIGPNGAGKTTLLNIISGIYRPDKGSIFFKGENLVGQKPHRISRMGIARTFQSVRTFLDQTVFENVTAGAIFGRSGTHFDKEGHKVREVLSTLNLSTKSNLLTSRLTIKERRYVEIGRALAASPALLLLDEPMAGLTPAEIKDLAGIIQSINQKGIEIILVEHVMKALMNLSTRIVVLHHGEKIAEGPPREISRDKRVIEIYLGEKYAAS